MEKQKDKNLQKDKGEKVARCENHLGLLPAAAAKSLQSCLTLCDPTDGSHQAPPSLGFSKQEHEWVGLCIRPCKRTYMEKVEVILDFERWDLRRVTE